MGGGQWLWLALILAAYLLVWALARSSKMRDEYERESHRELMRELRRTDAANRSRRRR